MPLFMDFHNIENVTIEVVETGHPADEKIQAKYGVRYHQFRINEKGGAVFFLMEGPDKAACEAVHRAAHGNTACVITEVDPAFLKMITGERVDVQEVKNRDGDIDLGYRNIMLVTIRGISKATTPHAFREMIKPSWARQLVYDKINSCSGRMVHWDKDDSIISVFNEADLAIDCALTIHRELLNAENNLPAVVFKIGISAGMTVNSSGDFFNEAITLARRLSQVAPERSIFISNMVSHLASDLVDLTERLSFKTINKKEEKFITDLFTLAENNLHDHSYSLNKLSHDVCVSRPQLYRKITALTGKSPHDFLHDLRMDKALSLLSYNAGNIAEVAFAVGFHSPSYFTRCFMEKFGCAPSMYIKAAE